MVCLKAGADRGGLPWYAGRHGRIQRVYHSMLEGRDGFIYHGILKGIA